MVPFWRFLATARPLPPSALPWNQRNGPVVRRVPRSFPGIAVVTGIYCRMLTPKRRIQFARLAAPWPRIIQLTLDNQAVLLVLHKALSPVAERAVCALGSYKSAKWKTQRPPTATPTALLRDICVTCAKRMLTRKPRKRKEKNESRENREKHENCKNCEYRANGTKREKREKRETVNVRKFTSAVNTVKCQLSSMPVFTRQNSLKRRQTHPIFCLSIHLSLYLSMYLSIYLYIYLSISIQL